MTLLVDRVRTDKSLKRMRDDPDVKELVEWMRTGYLPVYEISNVSEYLKSSGAQFGSLEDFPNVAPPHIAYWMEWRDPAKLISIGAVNHPQRVAILFWQGGEPDSDGVWTVGVHAWGMWGNSRPEPLVSWEIALQPGGFPVIRATHVMVGIHALFENPTSPTPQGDPIIPDVTSRAKALERLKQAQLDLEKANQDLKDVNAKMDETLEVWVRLAVLHPALMAHSLLACKNVDTEDHRPIPKLSKNFQRRHGMFLVSYKTLKVSAMGGSRQHAKGLGTKDQRLHIMRGHFKTFTPERPLFGRITGTYWWSPGLRGNAKRGAVVKDYAVQMPKKDLSDV